MRRTITARTIAAACPKSDQPPCPESESRIGRSWSPINANSSTFRRNVRTSQKPWPIRRVCTVVNSGVYQPM